MPRRLTKRPVRSSHNKVGHVEKSTTKGAALRRAIRLETDKALKPTLRKEGKSKRQSADELQAIRSAEQTPQGTPQPIDQTTGELIEKAAFDETGYLDLHADVRHAVDLGQFDSGYAHYVACGHAEGRALPILPTEAGRNSSLGSLGARHIQPTSEILSKEMAPIEAGDHIGVLEIEQSGLFQRIWYLQENSDVASAGRDPLGHFCQFGWRELRRPNAYFDPTWYVAQIDPEMVLGGNPLLHYIRIGERQGLRPIIYFDPNWYRAQHGLRKDEPALGHYLRHVATGTVSPIPEFDVGFYLEENPHVRAAGVDPFLHFLESGYREGRNPSSTFDMTFYSRKYLGGAQTENPLLHYLAYRQDPTILTRAPPKSPPPEIAIASFGPSIEGAVDRLTRWGATGWACMPGNPEQNLLVEAVFDGRVIGSSTADQMRPDLAEHGKGTGRYGFVLDFNEPVSGQELPLIRVAGAEGPTVLSCPEGSVHEFGERAATPSPPVSSPPPASSRSSSFEVEGYVDVLTRHDASGWAWLPSAPNKAVQIEAVLNGKVIGRGLADQPRADLLKYGKGTGQYGFKIAFEEPIVGSDLPEIRGLLAVGEPLSGPSALPALTPKDTLPRGTVTSLIREHAAFTSAGPEYEDFDSSILAKYKSKKQNDQQLELIAFYLPQFHPIPENDQFWGKGFTEWRQLPKGLPRFPGHYQPRIPRDLGFYDLEDVENLRAQTKLAEAAGITAFAFYYYWFNRKRVLDRPLELLLKSDINLPFLLIWANENWTRAWDGTESQVLLKQDYNADDDEALVGDLARHFSDDRYFRLNGRPLFVIYNPKNIPNSAATIEKWRGLLKTQHGLNPLIFMAQAFGERDPTIFGLDGAIEFPPHKLADTSPGRPTPDSYSKDFAGRVIPYEEFVSASLDEDESPFPLIKTIVPSWDNDARRPNRGLALEGSSPKKYQNWLQELISRALKALFLALPLS